jgi:hypothetical protein
MGSELKSSKRYSTLIKFFLKQVGNDRTLRLADPLKAAAVVAFPVSNEVGISSPPVQCARISASATTQDGYGARWTYRVVYQLDTWKDTPITLRVFKEVLQLG